MYNPTVQHLKSVKEFGVIRNVLHPETSTNISATILVDVDLRLQLITTIIVLIVGLPWNPAPRTEFVCAEPTTSVSKYWKRHPMQDCSTENWGAGIKLGKERKGHSVMHELKNAERQQVCSMPSSQSWKMWESRGLVEHPCSLGSENVTWLSNFRFITRSKANLLPANPLRENMVRTWPWGSRPY